MPKHDVQHATNLTLILKAISRLHFNLQGTRIEQTIITNYENIWYIPENQKKYNLSP